MMSCYVKIVVVLINQKPGILLSQASSAFTFVMLHEALLKLSGTGG
ncbi:MAG: hypothetical protein U9Q92_07195 [archaeon]|nr:hypothetical protein [archaeon]